MTKKVLAFLFLSMSLISYGQTPTMSPTILPVPPTKSQVTIMPPTLLRINYGDSYLEMPLTQNHNANMFKIGYNKSPACPIAPQVAIQVKYEGNNNWYNTSVEQGVFRHQGFRLQALKLLFRLTQYASVDCEMFVTGME